MSSVKINHIKYKVLKRRIPAKELSNLNISEGVKAKTVLTAAGEKAVAKSGDKWVFITYKPKSTVRL